MSQSAIGKIARRSLFYIELALAALAVIGLLVAISVHTGTAFTGGWIGLIGYTCLLFWVTIGKSREHWHRPMFWLTIVSLLGVHLLVFIAVLRSYPQWRMIWFLPIVVIEAGLFWAVLDALFGPPKKSVGAENVFDVFTRSTGKALDGTNYTDW